MYNRRPDERGTDGGTPNGRRGRGTTDADTTAYSNGRTAWTAGSDVGITVTWEGRTAKKAGSHNPITITIPGLVAGENLVQPLLRVVVRGVGDLVHRGLLVVVRDRRRRRVGRRGSSGAASGC